MKNKLNHIIEDALIQFYLEADKATIDEMLGHDDIDAAERKKRKKMFANKIRFLSLATVQKERSEKLLEKATTLFKDAISKNLDKPLNVLKGMIQRQELSVQFRSLDRLTEENIKEIIKDANLIEIIEQLEDEAED